MHMNLPQDVILAWERGEWQALAARMDTAALRQGDTPTKALVVFNTGSAPASAVAVFRARFPVRAEVGPQPVAVRDEAGRTVPSRIVNETLTGDAAHPGKRIWEFDLLFRADDVPARGWRAYAATYGRASDAPEWEEPAASSPTLRALETDCHPGDVPGTGSVGTGAAPPQG